MNLLTEFHRGLDILFRDFERRVVFATVQILRELFNRPLDSVGGREVDQLHTAIQKEARSLGEILYSRQLFINSVICS